jgi:hypothetical protein
MGLILDNQPGQTPLDEDEKEGCPQGGVDGEYRSFCTKKTNKIAHLSL